MNGEPLWNFKKLRQGVVLVSMEGLNRSAIMVQIAAITHDSSYDDTLSYEIERAKVGKYGDPTETYAELLEDQEEEK